ncbi:hypothetical protein KUTeg_021613 [Tegillarca granosa]|uniref:Uncharacterized protein n=1 Tax=Tegillarca granosa TaxID=220873 RepID=A0ABQ9E3T4_TEGGR|nr:hypothetical protein KUTeg_021613 [Tegillarca granosa]
MYQSFHFLKGKSVVSIYFNSRRYNVWRSHFDDSDDEEIDFEAEEHAMDETEKGHSCGEL